MRNMERIGVRAIASHQQPAGAARFDAMEAGASCRLCQLAQRDMEVAVQTSLQRVAVFELTVKRRRLHSPGPPVP